MSWFVRGIANGIRTERTPDDGSAPPGATPGFPQETAFGDAAEAERVAATCPNDALRVEGRSVRVVDERCVHCRRCARVEPALTWRDGARWERWVRESPMREFARSIHVRVVDAGDCGACLSELLQLNGPAYNLHRFGIFFTPTPRHADVLLVVGPVTANMRQPLRETYEAMPRPKRVVAVGACAVSGGIFGPSRQCGSGADDVVPVDLIVPGCPPPPLAIVAALRTVCGQLAVAERSS